MTVGPRAAMAWHMLDHRQHPAGQCPFDHGAPQSDDYVWVRAEGAIANDVVRAGFRHVENRRAIDGDAERVKLSGDQARAGEGCRHRSQGIVRVKLAISPRRRHLAPIWCAQALHAATLLIDEHQRLIAFDRVPKVTDERSELVGRGAVAREEDQAARQRLSEESALVVTENGAGAAGDEGSEIHHAGLTTTRPRVKPR